MAKLQAEALTAARAFRKAQRIVTGLEAKGPRLEEKKPLLRQRLKDIDRAIKALPAELRAAEAELETRRKVVEAYGLDPDEVMGWPDDAPETGTD